MSEVALCRSECEVVDGDVDGAGVFIVMVCDDVFAFVEDLWEGEFVVSGVCDAGVVVAVFDLYVAVVGHPNLMGFKNFVVLNGIFAFEGGRDVVLERFFVEYEIVYDDIACGQELVGGGQHGHGGADFIAFEF